MANLFPAVRSIARENVKRRIIADGGSMRIRLKLRDVDGTDLSQLKTICGRKAGIRPLKNINLVMKLPLQGKGVYGETLARLARRTPLTVNINYPFKIPAKNFKYWSISFDVASPEVTEIGEALQIALADFQNLVGRRTIRKVAPQFSLFRHLSDKEVGQKLAFVQQNYQKGIRAVTAVGLCLQFEPAFPAYKPPEFEWPPEQIYFFSEPSDVD
jgi:hypothetical protein